MVTSAQCLKKYGDPNLQKSMVLFDVPTEQERGLIPKRIECKKDFVAPLTQAFKNLISTGHVKEIKTWEKDRLTKTENLTCGIFCNSQFSLNNAKCPSAFLLAGSIDTKYWTLLSFQSGITTYNTSNTFNIKLGIFVIVFLKSLSTLLICLNDGTCNPGVLSTRAKSLQ
jgi:hypothetical protein